MAKKVPQVELTEEQVARIQAWTVSRDELTSIKAFELQYRMDVINTIPFDADKEEGGQTVSLYGGWKLALDRPMDHKMDPKNNEAVCAAMAELAAVNPDAIIDLIRWEPVMSVAAYKKLTEAEKLILAPVVTSKPGTPTLTLKPPPVPKA